MDDRNPVMHTASQATHATKENAASMDTATQTTELDPNIIPLVEKLNKFSGVCTIGSCGGHPNPSGGQWGDGTFYVKFNLDLTTEEGRKTLTFLGWYFNVYCRLPGNSLDVELLPYAAEGVPYWVIQGRCDPEKVAEGM